TTRPVTGSATSRKTAAVIMPSTEAIPRPACWKDMEAVSASAEAIESTSPEARSAGRFAEVSAAWVISTRSACASRSRAALHERAPKRYPRLSTGNSAPTPMIETMSIGHDSGMIARSTTIPISTGTSASQTWHSESMKAPSSSSDRRRRAALIRKDGQEEGKLGTKATLPSLPRTRFLVVLGPALCGDRPYSVPMTILRNVRLVGDGGPAQPVDVEFDAAITSIRPAAEPAPQAAKTLLPGLIDTHVHLGERSRLVDALRSGLTSVVDLGTHPAPLTDSRPPATGRPPSAVPGPPPP